MVPKALQDAGDMRICECDPNADKAKNMQWDGTWFGTNCKLQEGGELTTKPCNLQLGVRTSPESKARRSQLSRTRKRISTPSSVWVRRSTRARGHQKERQGEGTVRTERDRPARTRRLSQATEEAQGLADQLLRNHVARPTKPGLEWC